MNSLLTEKCEIASKGSISISGAELLNYMEKAPGWQLVNKGDIVALSRVFESIDYLSGLNFVKDIANLSESNDHHPSITFEYSRVTVNWWTHSINGLHRNDFIMAAKTDVCWKLHTSYRQ